LLAKINHQSINPLQLRRKEGLCREQIHLAERLDPCFARLQVYTAAALFELHLPLLQYGKRKWEAGEIPTEEFRWVTNDEMLYRKYRKRLIKCD
jgi:hypothetical protein